MFSGFVTLFVYWLAHRNSRVFCAVGFTKFCGEKREEERNKLEEVRASPDHYREGPWTKQK